MKAFWIAVICGLGSLLNPGIGFSQENMCGSPKQWEPDKQIASLPPPYCNVSALLPLNVHGWNTNGRELETLIKVNRVEVAVELGVWLGKSALHIASALPQSGKLYAVDHWLGSAEHQNPNGGQLYDLLPTLYEQFLSNVIHYEMCDKIIPWKMTTVEAARAMACEDRIIDLIYVDASHDTESVYEDLCNWFPYVQGHGIICGDDWSWGGCWNYPVRQGVIKFANEMGLEIHLPTQNFWILLE